MGRAVRGLHPEAGGLLKFTEAPLRGAWVIEVQPHPDERGHFARIFCEAEFGAHGLQTRWPQLNLSHNKQRGTLRGMHYQAAPHGETKVVRCVRGAIFDVMVDLRPDSPTRYRWHGLELSADNGQAAYIPEGFAHGFQTLQDDTEVLYLMSCPYEPSAARGFRWDDRSIGIAWPLASPIVGVRDAALPLALEGV